MTKKTPPLTAKQATFCAEYLIDLNATAAARRAGYAHKNAEQIGYQLLQKTSVVQQIQKLMDQRSQAQKWDAQQVLARLIEEANADIADIYTATGDLRPVHEWPAVWRRGLVSGIEVDALFEGTGKDRVHIGYAKKVKLSDRIKRLELIGKHVTIGAFKEKVEHDAADPLKELMQEISGNFIKPKEG